jgi:LmbE family N-acetylglucosaminyl deacetylase
MDEFPPLSAQDRVLIFAPHPDDEALGAGGLIQRAVAAHAKVLVVFATDGENNPWPQRVVERRLKIRSSDRARWGKRRRKEAQLALAHLGLPAASARFLGFPDQGITRFLLGASEIPVAAIGEVLSNLKPTLIVMPSPRDVHPDHNGLSVLIRIALSRHKRPVRVLNYLVHARGRQTDRHRLALLLSPEEKLIKKQAILCHASQMKLSRRRFVAYAKTIETFHALADPAHSDAHSPIWHAAIENGALTLHIQRRRLTRPGTVIHVVIESIEHGSLRWRLPLQSRSRRVHIRDTPTGAKLRQATVRVDGKNAVVNLPIATVLPVTGVFVKLDCKLGFFDDAGWREVPVLNPASASAVPGATVAHAAS